MSLQEVCSSLRFLPYSADAAGTMLRQVETLLCVNGMHGCRHIVMSCV